MIWRCPTHSRRTKTRTPYTLLFWVACLLVLMVAWPVQAQEFGRAAEIQASGTSYNVFTRPGKATVQVLVLGATSGIYEVSVETSLVQLLALIGTVSLESSGQTRRRVTIRLLRQEGDQRTPVYEARLEQLLLEPHRHPALQDGDMLLIETVERTKFSWRDALSLVTTAASLVLLAERLRRL